MGLDCHCRLLGVSVCRGRWNGRGLFLLGGGGLGERGAWCFMSNSSPGLPIVSHFKIRCMVPLKWHFREFFPSIAAAFLCIAPGRLGEASEPGVCWSRGSTLNLEVKLRHRASESCIVLLGFMVSD